MNNLVGGTRPQSLAVIIPAYKDKYLGKTLDSFLKQTNKDFVIYIGDDNSPCDLCSIIEKYEHLLDIRYTRFNDNIGAKNLVLQWKRCVELSGSEEWIWLFSDDDLADPNCVENFYATIKRKNDRFDVYRFNVTVIDKNDEVLFDTPVGPDEETSEQMAYHLLSGERGNSMPDHIFKREVYNNSGGFVFTEYAQGADWATSILFSQKKGICIIPDAKIYWRYSGENISSTASKNKGEMIGGHLQFLQWVLDHFEYLKTSNGDVDLNKITDAARLNLRIVMMGHFKGLKLNDEITIYKFLRNELNISFYNSCKELLLIKTVDPIYKRVFNLLVAIKKFLLKSA